MDNHSLELLLHDAAEALEQQHLQRALDLLSAILHQVGNARMLYTLQDISNDYQLMLRYMTEGADDPQRPDIHLRLTQRTYKLLCGAARMHRIAEKDDIYTRALNPALCTNPELPTQLMGRALALCNQLSAGNTQAGSQPSPTTEEQAAGASTASPQDRTALAEELGTAMEQCFNFLFAEAPLTHSQQQELAQWLPELPSYYRAFLTAALQLSCMEYLDPCRLHLILQLCSDSHLRVQARAITALVLVYMRHHRQLQYFPTLLKGIRLMIEEHCQEVERLQERLLVSAHTGEAQRKLKEEILPGIIHNYDYQRGKLGMLLNDLQSSDATADADHRKAREQAEHHLQEIVHMEQEGIDVNLATFSNLKHFSFFKHTANWLLPFSYRQKEVAAMFAPDNQGQLMARLLVEQGNMCDSDRYSLCLMMQRLSPTMRQEMTQQIAGQLPEGLADLPTRASRAPQDLRRHYAHYLQDLYRLHKLHPQHATLFDPFSLSPVLTDYPLLAQCLSAQEYKERMAPRLVAYRYYAAAIGYYESLMRDKPANASLLRQMAYCHYCTGNTSRALYCYQQADVLEPDHSDTIRKMMQCHAALEHHSEALACLERLLVQTPDDLKLVSECGLCLMHMGEYAKAAQRFHEMEYKGGPSLKAWRAIAWCDFKMKRYEQAERYYRKITDSGKARWEDYLNLGHVLWCAGHTHEAVTSYGEYRTRYSQAVKCEGEKALEPFDNDRDELLAQGIAALDIALMRDIIGSTA